VIDRRGTLRSTPDGTVGIGKLEPVHLRDLWKHEERGFSLWLREHIDPLTEVLGFPLTEVESEKNVGSFSVDLIAEDHRGMLVIIENQLEATDHDHLGKLLTYLTNLDAKRAVWITSHPRTEHIKAVTWLNETTPEDISFYLVKIAAYRIGDSEPAPLFTVIVGPSRDAKDIGKEKKELAERHGLRLRFWEQLLQAIKDKGISLHANRSPSTTNWLGAGAGKSGLAFVYVVWLQRSGVELYIDTGEKAQNKAIFNHLYGKKAEIEGAYGASLQWERLDEKQASRIRDTLKTGGLKDDESKWPTIQEAMIAAMSRLVKALKPQLLALDIQTLDATTDETEPASFVAGGSPAGEA
jgi:hypothetical protein